MSGDDIGVSVWCECVVGVTSHCQSNGLGSAQAVEEDYGVVALYIRNCLTLINAYIVVIFKR